MNLTEAEQRRLTEFLGECWHEWRYIYDATDNIQQPTCTKCHGTWGKDPLPRLDFTDWRVVGRLMVVAMLKAERPIYVHVYNNGQGLYSLASFKGKEIIIKGDQPQEAICMAILNYIKENKK